MRTIAQLGLTGLIVFFGCDASAGPILGIARGNPDRVPSIELRQVRDALSDSSPERPSAPAGEKNFANGIYMSGTLTYVFSNGIVSITLDQINNDSYTITTGTLRLSVWATTYQPARGAGLTGYRLANLPTFAALAPRTYYYNIVRTGPFTAPPDGTYWITVSLDQYNPAGCPTSSDGFCNEDTFVSTQQATWGTRLPTYNYTDIWWNSAESGWGVVVTHHTSNVAFVAWYTYDGAGNPKWYVATCPLNGDSCSGTLYETTGPAFGQTFNPSAVTSRNVGTISFTFTGQNSGVMTYNVHGSTGAKSITRQPF